jgi:hypothetical protein
MNEAAIIVSLSPPTSVDEDGMGLNPDLEKQIYHTIRNLRVAGVQEIIVVVTYKAEPFRRKLQIIGIRMIRETPKNDVSEAGLYKIGKDHLKKDYDYVSQISIST